MSETIGTQLEAARQASQLSIEDVAHETRIHRDVLCQLESDDYSKFPNLMFLKSFLKLYSQYLGVDASETLARLSADARRHGEQYLLGGIDPQIRERYGHLTSRIPVRPILASVAALALLAISGEYLVSRLYASDSTPEAKTASPTPDLEDLAPKEKADEPEVAMAPLLPDQTKLDGVDSSMVSSPAKPAPRAIPKVIVPAQGEFEIQEKPPIDPDAIPKASPIIRTTEPSEPSASGQAQQASDGGSDEADPDQVEILSDGIEPAVDISTVEE